jgi:hypothetical protein
MNDRAAWDGLLDTFAAELTHAAYHVALRHGAAATWLDLQLELWQALAVTVKQWGTEILPRPGANRVAAGGAHDLG